MKDWKHGSFAFGSGIVCPNFPGASFSSVETSRDSNNDSSNSNTATGNLGNPFLKFLVCGDVQDVVQISLTWHVSCQVCQQTTELRPVVHFRRLPYHSTTMRTNRVNMPGRLSCIPWVPDSKDSNWVLFGTIEGLIYEQHPIGVYEIFYASVLSKSLGWSGENRHWSSTMNLYWWTPVKWHSKLWNSVRNKRFREIHSSFAMHPSIHPIGLLEAPAQPKIPAWGTK